MTEGISGHWARLLGDRVWETMGSVSHLQRVDGSEKVWRVGDTRMALAAERLNEQLRSLPALSAALAAFTSLREVKEEATEPPRAERVPTLELKLPRWDLEVGEVVEVRTREPVENTSTYKWTDWLPAVARPYFH